MALGDGGEVEAEAPQPLLRHVEAPVGAQELEGPVVMVVVLRCVMGGSGRRLVCLHI